MQITTITVYAGRTFNNPNESYSNLKPSLSLTATLDPGDNPETAVKFLQGQAEKLIEEHKASLLKQLEDVRDFENAQMEIRRLEMPVHKSDAARERIEELKARFPGISAVAAIDGPDVQRIDDEPF
jgi:hypothetical protein